MAKKSEQSAASRETANNVGAPTDFLAEEEHLDRIALLRLGTWGVASVAAVIVAVLASQSSMKLRHEQVAAADLVRQSQQIQSIAKESANEARRLASAIDTLNGDRDRLFSRMSVLEQGLDSVTGSIARQNVAAAAPQAAPSPAPTPPPQPAAQNPAPVTAPVATAAVAENPRAEPKSPEPAQATKAVAVAAPVKSAPPEAPATAPLMASKSMVVPPDAAARKLIEPEPPAKPVAAALTVVPWPVQGASAPVLMGPPAPIVVASVPLADTAGADAAKPALLPLTVKRTEFAVDVGSANSVGGLRALWRGLIKTRSNAPLAALQPTIVVKEGSNGLGMQLRLVAGPLTDAAAAAKICAALIANQRPCETTVFDGQRLAIKAEPSTAAEAFSGKSDSEKSDSAKSDPAKSASGKFAKSAWHRRSPEKRVVVEEPPKQPEPTTLSSFFGRRSAQ